MAKKWFGLSVSATGVAGSGLHVETPEVVVSAERRPTTSIPARRKRERIFMAFSLSSAKPIIERFRCASRNRVLSGRRPETRPRSRHVGASPRLGSGPNREVGTEDVPPPLPVAEPGKNGIAKHRTPAYLPASAPGRERHTPSVVEGSPR